MHPTKYFFPITEQNIKIYNKLSETVKELIDKWWDKISTSKNADKYKKELEAYHQTLKSGDITLSCLITEGRQV